MEWMNEEKSGEDGEEKDGEEWMREVKHPKEKQMSGEKTGEEESRKEKKREDGEEEDERIVIGEEQKWSSNKQNV
jgi:hypothetical protein